MVPEMNKTVDQLEIKKFSNISYDWWNPEGKFATLHKINPIRVKFMLDLIFKTNQIDVHAERPLANFRVLDIGCGGGLSSEPFAKLGAHVCSVDADSQAIEVAKNHAKNENLKIDYKNCSVEDLSLKKDGKFDVILILELLEHIDDTNHFLSIALKYLKKNGVVFVSTINKNIPELRTIVLRKVQENPLKILVIYNFLAILELIQDAKIKLSIGNGLNNFWISKVK